MIKCPGDEVGEVSDVALALLTCRYTSEVGPSASGLQVATGDGNHGEGTGLPPPGPCGPSPGT